MLTKRWKKNEFDRHENELWLRTGFGLLWSICFIYSSADAGYETFVLCVSYLNVTRTCLTASKKSRIDRANDFVKFIQIFIATISLALLRFAAKIYNATGSNERDTALWKLQPSVVGIDLNSMNKFINDNQS